MSSEQLEAYDGTDEIGSDPWGVLDRDNRNHRKKRRLLAEATAAEPGDRILEVGCGDGLHAREWAREYDLVAVDLSPSLCRETRQTAPDAAVVQADATDLPLADGSVSAVVGAAVLHHLPDVQAALAEWARVARESVTLTEPNYLFPKDLVTAHCVPEERHKTQMAPWRLREAVGHVEGDWRVQHRLWTPPWPAAAAGLWDRVDAAARRVPGVRAASQLLRVHGEV